MAGAKPATNAALGGGAGARTRGMFAKMLADADKNLSGSFEAAEKSVGNLEKEIGGVKTHVESAAEAAKNMWIHFMGATAAAGALAAISYKIAGVFSHLLHIGSRVSDDWEVVRMEIEQLTHSTEKAGDMMDRLVGFSLDSGMAVPQIYELSRGMIKADYTAGQMDATLRMLMDAAGGNAGRFSTLASIFQRMTDGGMRNASSAFLRLRAQGILTSKDLAVYFKTTEKGVAAFVKTATTGDLVRILKQITGEGGRMNGAFKKMMESSRMLSLMLQRNIELFAHGVWAGINDWASAFVKVMTNVVKLFTAMPKHIKSSVGWFLLFGAAAATATAMVFGLTMAFAGLAAAIAATGLVSGGLVPIVAALVLGCLIAVPVLMGLVGAFVGVSGAADLWMAAWNAASATWDYFVSVLTRAGVFAVINNLRDIFDRFMDITVMVSNAIISLFVPGIRIAGQVIDSVLVNALKAAIMPQAMLIETMLTLIEWTQVFATFWSEIWRQIPNAVVGAFMYMGDIIKNSFNMIIDHIKYTLESIIVTIGRVLEEMEVMKQTLLAAAKFEVLTAGQERGIREQHQGMVGGITKNLGLDQKSGVKNPFAASDTTKEFLKMTGLEDLGRRMWNEKDRLFGLRRNNRKPEGVPEPPGHAEITKKGIYDIEGFGKMIQDAFLNQEGDATTNAINYGNTLQERQLAQNEKLQQTLDVGLGLA